MFPSSDGVFSHLGANFLNLEFVCFFCGWLDGKIGVKICATNAALRLLVAAIF